VNDGLRGAALTRADVALDLNHRGDPLKRITELLQVKPASRSEAVSAQPDRRNERHHARGVHENAAC
jgi:hypothetical protein